MTDLRDAGDLNFESWVCPLPLRDTPAIVMGHGGGGAMSGELIEHLFLPAYGAAAQADMGDSAVLVAGKTRLAFSTDSYVVKPMFFPGGNIGDLAVNGTVNDLAMSGATPMFLSTAFILAEGTALSELGRIAASVGAAALAAGVKLVAGDTKVVDSASGDGVYLNTTGIGLLADGIEINPTRARPGDVVLVSGDIGLHEIAVMSCRVGLIAIVPAGSSDRVLAAMQAHPRGRSACRIGSCVPDHAGMVLARTSLGGTRVVDLPVGEQLPRIC